MKTLCLCLGAALTAGLLTSCESPKPAAAACPHCAASGGKGKVCPVPPADEEKMAGPVQPGGVYLVW